MSDEAVPTIIAEISDDQWTVALFLLIFSASLSLIGSVTIALKILRDRKRNRTLSPYDRIVLGLSCSDIFASIVYAVFPFLLPSESHLWSWAFGSSVTCEAAGFLLQLFPFWAIWYNCILSFYFVLTALSQLRRKDYFRKCELWMHLSGMFFPVTAITFYQRGWFGEIETIGICWVTDRSGQLVSMFVLGFAYFFLLFNYIAIYIIVRKSLGATNESDHLAGPTTVQRQLKKEATTIMFLYVGCYLIPIVPLVVAQILSEMFNYDKSHHWYVLTVTLLPLQGFFNCFIYIKPAYTRFRAVNPNKSMYFVLHEALFNPSIPQLYYPSDASSNIVDEESEMFNFNFKENAELDASDPNDREDSKEEE